MEYIASNLSVSSNYDVLNALGYGGSVAALGITIVFLSLVVLILIIKIYPVIIKVMIEKTAGIKANRAVRKKKRSKCDNPNGMFTKASDLETIEYNEMVAIILASFDTMFGSSNDIKVKSITQIDS